MCIFFIIIILSIILLLGLVNYYIRRYIYSRRKNKLPWYNSDNFVAINGISTHYIVKGEGEPLILVHGSQMNIYDWRYNFEYLSKHFKVYALDMPGCGYSDKPKIIYSPYFFSTHILGFMDYFSINRASFAASSWGGGHTLQFALLHPNRVNKLILSSPCGIPHEMKMINVMLGIPMINRFIMLFISKRIIKSQLNAAFEKKDLINSVLIDSVYYPLLMKGGIYATTQSYQNADFSYVRKHLSKINIPTLIFWGNKDKIHDLKMMSEMNGMINGSKLLIVDNVGHMPHEEAFDYFNYETLHFLKKSIQQ